MGGADQSEGSDENELFAPAAVAARGLEFGEANVAGAIFGADVVSVPFAAMTDGTNGQLRFAARALVDPDPCFSRESENQNCRRKRDDTLATRSQARAALPRHMATCSGSTCRPVKWTVVVWIRGVRFRGEKRSARENR